MKQKDENRFCSPFDPDSPDIYRGEGERGFNKILISLCILLLTLFASCNDSGNRIALPGSTGKTGEIIIVMPENGWTGKPGNALRLCLAAEHPALPQPEPMFTLVQIPPPAFKGIFKTHRNVFIIRSSDTSGKDSFISRHGAWSKEQVSMELTLSRNQDMDRFLKNNCSLITDFFRKSERSRMIANYSKLADKTVMQEISSTQGISLTVPKGYKSMRNTNNFTWLQRETEETIQGILIYSVPYTDSVFTGDNRLRSIRDSVCKINVPGPSAGSYMMTMSDFPLVKTEIHHGRFPALEIRGLWQVQNDFMGGPFVALFLSDRQKKRLICIEGFVFAPKYDKREYLRQVDAIVYSAKVN